MQATKKLDAIDPTGWKRKAVRTLDVEITPESDPVLRAYYLKVNSDLDHPRHLMRAGYLNERRDWLGSIANALQKGWPIPEDDFNELIAALQAMASGEAPAKAMGLNPRKGRSKDSLLLEKQRKVAGDVYSFSKAGHPLSVEGVTSKDSAFYRAAEANGVPERMAREAWAIFGETIREFWETGIWQENLPSVKKLTQKAKQQANHRTRKRIPRK